MAQFQLKQGLGTFGRKPAKIWHVVKDGKTVHSDIYRDWCIRWIRTMYGEDAVEQAIRNEKGL